MKQDEHAPGIGSDAERVPSIPALIASSVGPVENDGATALDDVRDNLLERERLETAPPAPTAPARRRHRKRGSATSTGRPRGRPRSDASPDISPAPAKEPLKAELAAQLAQTQSELASVRASHDVDAISELGTSLKMIAIVAYGFVADARGAHWALTADEAERIGTSSAAALAPYSATLNKNLPWLAALTTIAGVTWKRVEIDQKKARALEIIA